MSNIYEISVVIVNPYISFAVIPCISSGRTGRPDPANTFIKI